MLFVTKPQKSIVQKYKRKKKNAERGVFSANDRHTSLCIFCANLLFQSVLWNSTLITFEF